MEIIKPTIKGFKAFNKGLITRQGDKLELYKLYKTTQPPIFSSSGYHMCRNIEDTLRYFDTEQIEICEAEGYPEYTEYYDDYAGSDAMYSCQGILLTHLMTPEEIMEEAKKMNIFRFKKFADYYPLTEEQQKYFIEKFLNEPWILSHLIYKFFDNDIYRKISEDRIDITEVAKQYIKK